MPKVSTTFAPSARPRVRARALALLCAGAAGAGAALAEPNPYYVGAGLTLGHDSNVARAPEESTIDYSDSYTTGYLLAGIDQPIGRQRLYADGRVARTKFNDLSRFDFTGYNARLGLDWEALDRMEGDLRYATQRTRTTDAGGLANDEKNLETTQEFFFRAQYGLVSTFSLEGELVHSQLDVSNDAFETNEVSQDSVKLGIIYRPGGLLTLGAGVRYTKGDYDNREDGGFDRNDLELTARWDVTGQSTLEALLAIGNEDQDNPNFSDVSGLTGNVRWTYKPTGKLRFITELSRVRGRDSAFAGTGTDTGTDGSSGELIDVNQSRVSNTLQIGGLWEATAKIGVTADAAYTRRDLENTVDDVDAEGKDSTTTLGLGVKYEYSRNIEASCKVGREKRTTSGDPITLPYSANFVSCSLQALLR